MMNISLLHDYFLSSSGISTDTRNIKQNSIFFALKGKHFNGNHFAEKALEMGAAYAVVDEQQHADARLLVVDDVLLTLQQLANFHRKQLQCPVIGITGSNGKTTTKELINVVLNKAFKVCCTQGNLNNHIGVPLTILSADLETDFLIVEMGANHKGEIKLLSQIADIDYGIITNIGKAHLEGFGSFEGVISAKKELYDFIQQKNGTIFINKNDSLLSQLSKGMSKIEYDDNVLNGQSSFAKVNFKSTTIQSKLIGNYNCPNIKAACTVGYHFGVDLAKIKEAIEDYTPQNNRSQYIDTTRNNSLILDAYNANPSSMIEAIKSFNSIEHDKKLMILGDMLELGKESKMEHQKIIDFISGKNTDTILIGDEFGNCKNTFRQFDDVEQCANWLTSEQITNSLVLLKGSRGIKLEHLQAFL